MKFPVFSLLAGNFEASETSSLETLSSSGESNANPTFCLSSRRLALFLAIAGRPSGSYLKRRRLSRKRKQSALTIAGSIPDGATQARPTGCPSSPRPAISKSPAKTL
jgi:hypothetical protein